MSCAWACLHDVCIMNSGQKQILFLIDTAYSNISLLSTSTLYLACCKLLFLYAGFDSGKSGRTQHLKWDWRVFDSIADNSKVPLKGNTSSFRELRSETLLKFQASLKEKVKSSAHTAPSVGVSSNLRTAYNILVSVLQDYQWDTPFITSPSLPQKSRKSRTLSSKLCSESVLNVIFLVSRRFEDIARSCIEEIEGGTSGRGLQQCIKEDLFPNAVCMQLQNKNIKVYSVIDLTDATRDTVREINYTTCDCDGWSQGGAD